MKPLICLYCEGTDTKVAVVTKENDRIKVLKAEFISVLQPVMEVEDGISGLKIEGEDLELDNLKGQDLNLDQASNAASISSLNESLKGINLGKCQFLPALTEPSIYYHVYEGGEQAKSSRMAQDIIDDIQESKNVIVDRENLGYIELSDNSLLSVFLAGEVSCINMINALARYNGKRNYKIPSVKSAEISLSYYVSKRKKFFPDDHSLIVYIGKEYSKLIFLHGRKLKHIGSTLDIGTLNLHTYDVYFSKILLEMENGGISSLDNIIVCGEDDSENLILSFYGTFPEANVSRLDFDDLDLSLLNEETRDKFSAFSVPIAIATDYIDELANEHKGINLLPRYVKEEQKFFQFGWHGYAMLPLLFGATLFITVQVLNNQQDINQLHNKITQREILQRQNQQVLDQITQLQGKISSFGQTQAILDSASVGNDLWNGVLSQISNFFQNNKSIWLTKFVADGKQNVSLEGYSFSRNVITNFAYSINSATLMSVTYEQLRDANTYKFSVNFNPLAIQEKKK
jgi:hypothetical protein